jgi:hypothetical protein
MASLEEIETLRKAHANASAEANKAEGAYNAAMETLANTYHYDSIEAAREGHARAVAKAKAVKERLDKAYIEIVENYGDVLGISQTAN